VRDFSIALDLTAIRGVERADQIVPIAEEWPQVGSLPTHSSDVPVFCLAGLLGLPEASLQPGSQLLLTETSAGPVGLLVDQTSQGSAISQESFVRVPDLLQSPHFAAIVRMGSSLLPWLDPVSLFTGQSTIELPAAPPWHHRSSAGSQQRLMVISLPDALPGEREWSIGLPAAVVAEVIDPEVLRVPGTLSFVAGLMAWRDRIIAVLDLCQWLGLPSRGVERSLVAVLASPGASEPVGLLIPRGVRLLKLPIPNLRSERVFPGDSERIVASVEAEEQTIALLDLVRLTRAETTSLTTSVTDPV